MYENILRERNGFFCGVQRIIPESSNLFRNHSYIIFSYQWTQARPWQRSQLQRRNNQELLPFRSFASAASPNLGKKVQ